jgi:hypothetical protein
MYYIANLSRPDSLNHQACTDTACCYAHVDNPTYQTKHAEGCEGCSFVSADLDQLSVILKKETYPLIDFSKPTTSGNTLYLQSFASPERTTTSTPIQYVAISHVWSDGLGNTRHNSIPSCQLSRLIQLARNIPHESHLEPFTSFWLDTICCPVEDGSTLQNMAIHKMKDTYEKASAVLVLDASLMAHNSGNLDDIESIYRILICKWTSRLWTFQEGVFAWSLFFQFADGPYDLRQGLVRLMDNPTPSVRLTVQRSIVQQVNELCGSITPLDHADKLTIFAKALRSRTTSVLSDEPICLANLLGLDSRVISEIPSSDELSRMAAFWRLTSNMPLHVLFRSCERLCSPGLQWAPTSLLRTTAGINRLGHSGGSKHWAARKAEITDHGLHVRTAGFNIRSSWDLNNSRKFLIKATSGRWFVASNLYFAPATVSNGFPERPSDPHRNWMIVCPWQLQWQVPGFHSDCIGLLVQELDPGGNGRHRVRFVHYMAIFLMPEGWDDLLIQDLCSAMDEGNFPAYPIEEGEELCEDTQWCFV